ncbi:MAG: hypothetical protein KDM64_15530, partial [Verrucomicrobiae bacterium]|nr:hypothetical protein [Verrucomicrobiae bacterium]
MFVLQPREETLAVPERIGLIAVENAFSVESAGGRLYLRNTVDDGEWDLGSLLHPEKPSLLEFEFDGAGLSVVVRKNGNEVFQGAVGQVSTEPLGRLLIGGTSEVMESFGSSIAELVMFDSLIPEERRQEIENHWIQKYGITPSEPPSIELTSPVDGQEISGNLVSIGLNSSVVEGTNPVSKVEYFINGVPVATVGESPFEAIWNDVIPGAYAIQCRVTDTEGLWSTSSAVTVTVSDPGVGFVDLTTLLPEALVQNSGGGGSSYQPRNGIGAGGPNAPLVGVQDALGEVGSSSAYLDPVSGVNISPGDGCIGAAWKGKELKVDVFYGVSKTKESFGEDKNFRSMVLTWDAHSNGVGYEIFKRISSKEHKFEGSWKRVGVSVDCRFEDPNVYMGHSYFYKIIATGAEARS